MAEKKKLKLEGGVFKRDGKDDDASVLTAEQMIERAAACLDEAARSQTPNNEAYARQAELWMQMAEAVAPSR